MLRNYRVLHRKPLPMAGELGIYVTFCNPSPRQSSAGVIFVKVLSKMLHFSRLIGGVFDGE